MKSLAIIGCTVGGGLAGAVAGLAVGFRRMDLDDFGIGGLIGMFYGAIVGTIAGVTVGSVVFA